MTAPRPLCAWCGEPLGRRGPDGKHASIEASWHQRGLGVPAVGWHIGGEGSCFALDPLARKHDDRLHGQVDDGLQAYLNEIARRGPGRLVQGGVRQ